MGNVINTLKNGLNFLFPRTVPSAIITGTNETLADVLTEIRSSISAKQDKPIIKTTMDSVAVAGAQYFLGEIASLSITLPDAATNGQLITVDFASGTTPTSVPTIVGNVAGDTSYTPKANTLVEMSFKKSGDYWKMLVSDVPTPEEVTE